MSYLGQGLQTHAAIARYCSHLEWELKPYATPSQEAFRINPEELQDQLEVCFHVVIAYLMDAQVREKRPLAIAACEPILCADVELDGT